MRILLVEDEERMDQALCEILRQENYEVDHWGDGVKGQYHPGGQKERDPDADPYADGKERYR